MGFIIALVKEYNSEDPLSMKYLSPIMVENNSTLMKLSNEAFLRTSREMKNRQLTVYIQNDRTIETIKDPS